MKIIDVINMMEFRIGLMRHYVAAAFISEMEMKNDSPEFILDSFSVVLTPDRVSANIACYIERENITRYGVHMGQIINAEQLKGMLEADFMAEYEPQLSDYGQSLMIDIYTQIAHGGMDGVLPNEADICILAGDVGV